MISLNSIVKSVRPPTLGYARQHPLPRQSSQNRSHLVHKDIHRRIERDPGAGGHGQEAEPHANVEPLADAGTVQQLRLLGRPGRVLLCLLRRLGAATWRLGGRSAGGHGIGGPSQRPGRETRVSSPRVNTQEAATTKQPAIKDLSRLPPALPKLTLSGQWCPESFAPLPTTRCPGTDRRTGPSSSSLPQPS